MGTSMRTFIIAEAGVNHNGSTDIAMQLIDVAAEAGVDAVKFQSFRADSLVARNASKAEYQERNTNDEETQFDMLQKLELTQDSHRELIKYATQKGVEFLSTPFDTGSLHLLTENFGLKTIKVSSGDITNAPLLLDIARSARRVIISTGMSTLAEIEAALGVLAFGFTSSPDSIPQADSFEMSFSSDDGQHALKERVSILHCTTEYPAPFDEVNLRAMDTMAMSFGLPVGYSDHTLGIHVSIAAVARGARIIEKHFTLDRDLPGPDHKASLEPRELKRLVLSIRDVEQSIGDGIKRPTSTEWKNRLVSRKSLLVENAVVTGQPLELICKRPGTGISPFEYWSRAGQPSSRNYAADDLLDE